jgi:hypothetical protein
MKNVRYLKHGILELQTKRVSPPHPCTFNNSLHYYEYSSAYIGSKEKIQYGYIEVKCWFPADIALNPCFWLYAFTVPVPNDTIYDEIDVFERDKIYPAYNKMLQNAYHNSRIGGLKTVSNLSRNVFFNQPFGGGFTFTIYAIEWLPEELHYYINGTLITSVRYTTNSNVWNDQYNPWTCTDFTYAIPQWIQLSNVVNSWANQNTLVDFPFIIDYVKSFKLREDNSILEFWPPYFSMNYPGMFSVHKSIRLGGTGHTAIIPPNQNITMWAKDYIILDKGFTVAGNTEFTARTIKTQPALFIDSIPEKGKSNE